MNITYCVCAWGQGERGRGGREVLAVYLQLHMYAWGFSFDVSSFTTQTLPLMYPDCTGKAHPHPWTYFFYADIFTSHTLRHENIIYRGQHSDMLT